MSEIIGNGIFVGGSGGGTIESLSIIQNGTYTPPSGVNGYAPVIVNVVHGIPIEYEEVEYVGVTSAGPYIDTGIKSSSIAYFKLSAKYDEVPSNNYGLFGTMHGGEFVINSWDGSVYLAAGSDHANLQGSDMTKKHDYEANSSGIYIDGVKLGNASWEKASNAKNYMLFAFIYQDNTIYKTANARIYHCKIYNDEGLARWFIPCYRKSDDVIGFYDLISESFFVNSGSGAFIMG